jgi:RNA polymerase sigma factor (sigma-70 family)
VSQTLAVRLGRSPTREEIAEEAALTERECSMLCIAASRRLPWPSVEDESEYGDSGGDLNPESLLARRRELERLATARARLGIRLRNVLDLYYDADLLQREIGERLGVSEARVSQLRKLAIAELRGETRIAFLREEGP